MTRAARLLDLIQALRRHRRPVAAATLAEAMGVSLRTVYRDISTLTAQGAPIEGSAGLGYVLRSGFFLPPLAFSADELDAVILGLHLAAQRGDEALAADAANALAKIEAVLPPPEADEARAPGLQAPRSARGAPSLTVLRQAIRAEHRLKLAYVDKTGAATARVVWPITIGFFEAAEVLAAWCETRRDFRHFRLDRIKGAESTGERYGRRRAVLLAEWRAMQDIDG